MGAREKRMAQLQSPAIGRSGFQRCGNPDPASRSGSDRDRIAPQKLAPDLLSRDGVILQEENVHAEF